MDTYSRENRSFTNFNNGNSQKRDVSPRRYASPNFHNQSNMHFNNPLNKSTTSVHSQHLWNTLQQLQLFPAQLSELLRNEDRNITLFKNRIEKQKNKVAIDIDSFKKELVHYVDDFKLSVWAELDRVYKAYMEKYAKLKGQVLQIKRLRDQIEFEVSAKGQNVNNFKSSHLSASNINTVKSIENGLKDMKKYHILNYISELQKSKIAPVTQDAKDLIILTEYDNGYYLHKELNRMLNNQKQNMKVDFRKLYDNKYDYLREIQNVVGKERDQRGMLDELDDGKLQGGFKPEFDRDRDIDIENQRMLKDRAMKQRQRQRQRDRQRQIERQRQKQRERQRDRQRERQRQRQRERQLQRQRQSQRQRIERERMLEKQRELQRNHQRQFNKQIPVSPSKQISVYQWLQNPKVKYDFSVKPDTSDIILCALILPNDQIVIGGKDGMLNVYNITNGQRICSLKGHRASICSLALIKAQGVTYLASGSDHGCSSILMWQLPHMTLRHRLEGHKAAVTAIVDLLDNQNMVSGSYDKKINVYNMKTGQISYNLPTNKSSVTGIILNSTANKMISCGLDNSLNFWQVVRNNNTQNTVETLFLERVVQNDAMICSMVGSMLNQNTIYIGTKDGKIKAIDVDKGDCSKTMSCCNNAVIQMVVLERESHPYNPIIVAWPCKQECFKLIDTENGKITNVPARGHIQFGCGIGPKGLLVSNHGKGYIAMLSQSQTRKEVIFYDIQNGTL